MGRHNCKFKLATDSKHIVSFRVSNEEKKLIDRLAKKNGMNTTSVLRAMLYSLKGAAEEVFSQYKENNIPKNFKRIDQ